MTRSRASHYAFAFIALVCASVACRNHQATPPTDASIAHARDVHAIAPPVDAAAIAMHVFEPQWACRITGHGYVAHMPHVSVPPLRPGAVAGTIGDVVPLSDGRTLHIEPVSNDAGATSQRARVFIRAAGDGGVETDRIIELRAGEQPMLFADDHGAGLAFWDGTHIVGERIGATGQETLVDAATDLTHTCSGPPRDALRLWPVFPRALPFPHVTGMPPSVADARYTLARSSDGVCVVRLEGEGPWGRVYADATAPDAGLVGQLSLAESVNPVTCARTTR